MPAICSVTRRIKTRKRTIEKLAKIERRSGAVPTCDSFLDCIPDIIAARVVCLLPDDMLQVAANLRALGENALLFADPPAHFKTYRVRWVTFSLLDTQQFTAAGFHVDPVHGRPLDTVRERGARGVSPRSS